MTRRVGLEVLVGLLSLALTKSTAVTLCPCLAEQLHAMRIRIPLCVYSPSIVFSIFIDLRDGHTSMPEPLEELQESSKTHQFEGRRPHQKKVVAHYMYIQSPRYVNPLLCQDRANSEKYM
ncbi:hypothetical protein FB451DRAFT_263912 [Mycena latifolia]|nr:hypothetical protein FB451DRAFT_263912 [Mycena latifolia]